MTISRTQNLLIRSASFSEPVLSVNQLRADALLSSAQEIAGDWKTAAAAIILPMVANRIANSFRNGMLLTRTATLTEMSTAETGALFLARTSSVSFLKPAATLLGLGAGLAACSEGIMIIVA